MSSQKQCHRFRKLMEGEVVSYIYSCTDEKGRVTVKAGGNGDGASAMLTAINAFVAKGMLLAGVSVPDAANDLRQIAVSGVRLASDELDGGAAP